MGLPAVTSCAMLVGLVLSPACLFSRCHSMWMQLKRKKSIRERCSDGLNWCLSLASMAWWGACCRVRFWTGFRGMNHRTVTVILRIRSLARCDFSWNKPSLGKGGSASVGRDRRLRAVPCYLHQSCSESLLLCWSLGSPVTGIFWL